MKIIRCGAVIEMRAANKNIPGRQREEEEKLAFDSKLKKKEK